MTRREREANPSPLELRRRAMAGDAPRDSSDPWEIVGWCERCERWKPLAFVDVRRSPTGLASGVCGDCDEREKAARAGVEDWLATGALEPKRGEDS